MGARKGKIVPIDDVRSDEYGSVCAHCMEPVYLDAIRKGEQVWRHTSKHPWREGCRA